MKHKTRKDFRHTSAGHMWSFYSKKWARGVASKQLRRHRGGVSDGGWFKRYSQVVYRVL